MLDLPLTKINRSLSSVFKERRADPCASGFSLVDVYCPIKFTEGYWGWGRKKEIGTLYRQMEESLNSSSVYPT